MAKGRKTGGRTKGTPNKLTAEQRARTLEVIQRAAKEGILPLEVMLREMRMIDAELRILRESEAAGSPVDPERYALLLKELRSWAVEAAEYCHAKLQRSTVTGEGGGPVHLEAVVSFRDK